MATLPAQDSPSPAPRAFSPRSPWFWLISGLGTLAVAVIVIVVLTATNVLPPRNVPRLPPAVRDAPVAEAPPPRDLEVPPNERQRVLRTRLVEIDARLNVLEQDRKHLRAALLAASANRGGNVEATILRADLAVADNLWMRLNTERDNLSARLRGS